jgi:GcrA cell cycle regulator
MPSGCWNVWPEERTAALRTLAEQGLSASQIGLRLGISRNAVIGKCQRDGIAMGLDRTIKTPAERAAAATASTARRVAWMRRKRAAGLPTAPTKASRYVARMATTVPSGHEVTILGLTETSCRYIAGDEITANVLYCGAVTEPDRPYCPAHCAVCFNGPV